ncbi:MAG: hypothetical protein CUN55_05790 [Phototrophicales bacterium]|nr:MAG: hypothetical protein CUN55_05790 [Phototrophicales bacterium]
MAPLLPQPHIMPYTPEHRSAIEFLMHHMHRVHYHLDWYAMEEWFSQTHPPSVVAYRDGEMIGALLFTPPHAHITWLRMVALHNQATSADFNSLMQAAIEIATQHDIEEILSLEMDSWLGNLLLANRYILIDKIIHYKRPAGLPIPECSSQYRIIHLFYSEPIDVLEARLVDHAAFEPRWQMQDDDFYAIGEASDLFIAVFFEQQIIGYLIASLYDEDMVHLSRIATDPNFQHRGVGMAMMHHLFSAYPQKAVTVNTQQTNIRSQRFYEKLQFQKLPYYHPVWLRKINT